MENWRANNDNNEASPPTITRGIEEMGGAILIAIVAAVAFGLSSTVAIIYRGKYVPVSWAIFLMMALGAFGVFVFYAGRIYDISHGNIHLLNFVTPSRALWGFAMAGTALLGISVLVAKRPKDAK